ncbi:MAG: PqqD family protein [Ruminococcaceae bacterium]|nr:PqqD family protein [Oscillospiraceae bacterium]
MKLKDCFILQKIEDDYIVVPTDSTLLEVGAMITLNETSAFIWRMLEKGSDKETIAQNMIKEYSIDKETALLDISEFINILKERNFLEE